MADCMAFTAQISANTAPGMSTLTVGNNLLAAELQVHVTFR